MINLSDQNLSLSSLKSLARRFEQNNALEYGVSCQPITHPTDDKKWTILVYVKEGHSTQKQCQSYLRKELKRQLPQLKYRPSLVKTSYELAQIAAHPKRKKAKIQKLIRAKLKGSNGYRWWKNKKYPTKIKLDKAITSIKKLKSTQFGVSCVSYEKDGQQKWAVAVYHK